MTIYEPLEHMIPVVVQASLVAITILIAAGYLINRSLAASNGGVVPDEGITLRNAFEVILEAIAGLAQSIIGEEWKRYFPIVGSIFVFILISNFLHLLPGVGGATSDVNTTTAWAIISFGVYNYVGVRKHGFWYINQFMGPSFFEMKIAGKKFHIRPLFWFFLPLEIFLHLARIGTLSVRLLANMFADHTVVAVWIKLVPVVIPAVFMALGMLVAVIQAFVFSLLTMIYIGMALEEAH